MRWSGIITSCALKTLEVMHAILNVISNQYIDIDFIFDEVITNGLSGQYLFHHKWNFLLVVSISLRLWTHSYSPNCVSKVPSCNQRSLRVNLGPSSCSRVFVFFFLLSFPPSPPSPPSVLVVRGLLLSSKIYR